MKIILAFNDMFIKGVALYNKCCEKSSLFNCFRIFIHLQVVPNGVDFRIPFLWTIKLYLLRSLSIFFLPEAHTPIFLYQQRWKPSSQWSSKYLLQCLATICLWQNRPRTQHMVSKIGVLTNIDFKNDGTLLPAWCDSNIL